MKNIPNILVCEGDPSLRDTLCEILKKHGNVLSTSNSEEAYREIRNHDFISLIIVNQRNNTEKKYSKRNTGIEIIKSVRKLFSADVPAILISGYFDLEKDKQIEKEFSFKLLSKPFNLDEFEQLSVRLIDDYKLKYGVCISINASFYSPDRDPNQLVINKPYQFCIEFSSIIEGRSRKKEIKHKRTEKRQLESNINITVTLKSDLFEIMPHSRNINLETNAENKSVDFTIIPKKAQSEKMSHTIFAFFYFGTRLLDFQEIQFSIIDYIKDQIPVTGLQKFDPLIKQTSMEVFPSKQPLVFSLAFFCDNNNIIGNFALPDSSFSDALHVPSIREWDDLNKMLRIALKNISMQGVGQINKNQCKLENTELLTFLNPLFEAGQDVFRQLFPKLENRETIRSIINNSIDRMDRVPIIEISSNQYLIDWDLINLSEANRHSLESMNEFWGMKCIVHKKNEYPGDIVNRDSLIGSSEKTKIGITRNTKFSSVLDHEIKFLNIFSDNVDIKESKNPLKTESKEFLLEKFDILQLACHGVSNSPISNSFFELSDSNRLTLMEIRNLPSDIKAKLVILSSCSSLHFIPGVDYSFLKTFINKGVQGVLGTEVPISSYFSSKFITDLYFRLLSGKPIGQCLLEARQYCWQNRTCYSPFGLFYSFYGNINLSLKKRVITDQKELSPREVLEYQCENMSCCYKFN